MLDVLFQFSLVFFIFLRSTIDASRISSLTHEEAQLPKNVRTAVFVCVLSVLTLPDVWPFTRVEKMKKVVNFRLLQDQQRI
jgi:hypothetical protein